MRAPRAVVLRELTMTVRRRRGRPCRVEVGNAWPRDRSFLRAVAALVAAWFDRA